MPTKVLSSLVFTFLLTACSTVSKPQAYTLNKNRTASCQDEIEKTITSLIHARNLSISNDVFSKTSTLHLTNQKDDILIKSPIYNDLKGRKTLMMYKENNDLYIGFVNEKEEVLKSQRIQNCVSSFK